MTFVTHMLYAGGSEKLTLFSRVIAKCRLGGKYSFLGTWQRARYMRN